MSISRRSFIKGVSLSGVVISTSSLSSFVLAAEGNSELKKRLFASKFGTFEAEVNNGQVQNVTPFKKDIQPNKMLEHVCGIIDNPSRIKYPMVRKGFLTGENSTRGNNEFVRISWEKAIDILYQQLEKTQKEHGPSGLLPIVSWGPFGSLGNCETTMFRGLNLHGKYLTTSGWYSTAAADAILPVVMGDTEVYSPQTSLSFVVDKTEIMILWGCDPLKNSQIGWMNPDHSMYPYWDQIKEKVAQGKMRVISIDPVRTETAEHVGAEQLSIKPQTDVALMLGIAHELYATGKYDAEFIEGYTDGADKFFPYLTGETDKTPKTAEWAADICGIDAKIIKALAHQCAEKMTLISTGYSPQRADHGEQFCWMAATLASMLGYVGLPGGGIAYGYTAYDAGAPVSDGAWLGTLSADVNIKPMHDKEFTSSNHFGTSRFVEVLENPGQKSTYRGKAITYPDVKAMVITGANPFSQHQDINRLVKAVNKLDFIATIDNQWTATCRYSDLVLPTTTIFERDDLIAFGGETTMRGVIGLHKLVEPMYEAKDDYEIWKMFAAKFGREHEFTEGNSQLQWLKKFYDATRNENLGNGIKMPEFEKFWTLDTPYIEYPGENAFVRHADFREDPDLNGLATDSGLIQIYSPTVAKLGYADCPGYPVWLEPKDWKDRKSGSYLHMTSLHPTNRIHSQLCGVQAIRDLVNPNDHEPLWINPLDAKGKNIVTGDIVEAYNDKGKVLFGAIVSEKVSQGVVATQEGGWYSPDGDTCLYGNVNILTSDRGTSSWAQGPVAQTCLVNINKYTGPKPKIDCFDGPVTVS